MSISHHQIFDAALGIAMVQKWPIVGKAWQFFDVFIIIDIKCDTSVTGKIRTAFIIDRMIGGRKQCFVATKSSFSAGPLYRRNCLQDTWFTELQTQSFGKRRKTLKMNF